LGRATENLRAVVIVRRSSRRAIKGPESGYVDRRVFEDETSRQDKRLDIPQTVKQDGA